MPAPEIDFEHRLAKYEEAKKKYLERIAPLKKPIEITLPDGSKREGMAYETRPIDIAEGISKGLALSVIAARVNENEIWDLGRPLESSCKLELLKWEDPDAREVFWHSSAHILGEALELNFGGLLCKGPPNKEDGGFYYESFMDDDTVNEADFDKLSKSVNKIIKEQQPFERLEISKEDAVEMFKYNKFKVEMLQQKVPEGSYCSVYRCGKLVDPCKGPHVLHTGRVKAFKLVKNSSSYWRADANNESLQRVYGMTFPSEKQLKEWVKIQEELKKLDHRFIGREQELWFSHDYAPGMYFFLPKGQAIYNRLADHIRSEQRRRGFTEVQTPNVFHNDLWKTSGHWYKYQDDMFQLEIDKCIHCLKPMNCPAHCLMFKHTKRSYRELPIRYSEVGILHRNELKGALSGMTRVRRFQQDDGHIFCRKDQIDSEMLGALDFVSHIYGLLDFEIQLFLSTRPEKYFGEVETWNEAEKMLANALEQFGHEWSYDHGGGAFYGPKIDIKVRDSFNRSHQCATIQLDFVLPERFDLTYDDKDSQSDEKSRPVMIHRAVYGSFERFLAIITEHLKGKWPFWLSPRQIMVIPAKPKDELFDYAEELAKQFRDEDFYAEADVSSNRLDKKIREAQLKQFNYILVVGPREKEHKSVNVRIRDCDGGIGEFSIDRIMQMFRHLQDKLVLAHGLPEELLNEEEREKQKQAIIAGEEQKEAKVQAAKEKEAKRKQKKGQNQPKKQSKKDSNGPKRPPSAFHLYVQDREPIVSQLKEVLQENGEVDSAKVKKMIAEEWRNLSEEEQKPFVERAEQEKKNFAKQ